MHRPFLMLQLVRAAPIRGIALVLDIVSKSYLIVLNQNRLAFLSMLKLLIERKCYL